MIAVLMASEWTVEKMIKKFNLNMWISTSEDSIHWEYRPNREDILKKINEIIDVVNAFEPKHGRWICINGWVECSVCHQEPPNESNIESDYCPSCGAKMDEVENG